MTECLLLIYMAFTAHLVWLYKAASWYSWLNLPLFLFLYSLSLSLTLTERKWETCQVGSAWFNSHSTNLSQIGASPPSWMHLGSHALTYLQRAIHPCVFITERKGLQVVTFTDINFHLKGPQGYPHKISVVYLNYTNLNSQKWEVSCWSTWHV